MARRRRREPPAEPLHLHRRRRALSSVGDIARIGFGYADWDNARVALAPDGAGFVTWDDAGGLHVANLEPLTPKKRKALPLRRRHRH